MAQATAVVLEKDPYRRDDLRVRLSNCGFLPICFDDEWICLENIYHVRPAFAVLRPDSREAVTRFISVAKAIRSALPVIVLSNKNEIESFFGNNWLANLFFLKYPTDEQELQGIIALIAETKQNLDRPVLPDPLIPKNGLNGCRFLASPTNRCLFRVNQGLGNGSWLKPSIAARLTKM
jgi:hypothetical protein